MRTTDIALLRDLLNTSKPSVGLSALLASGELAARFPELYALVGVQQSPDHHPEGDVWTHTLMVVDYASTLKSQAQHPEWFMLAALCHDLGKPATTTVDDQGKIHAYSHDVAGSGVAHKMLTRIGEDPDTIRYVSNMVLYHMQPNWKAVARNKVKSTNTLFDKSACPEDLLLLAEADHCGRTAYSDYSENRAWLCDRLQVYRDLMAKPQVTEADLLDIGVQPGAEMTDMLLLARKLHLSGASNHAVLQQIRAAIRKNRPKSLMHNGKPTARPTAPNQNKLEILDELADSVPSSITLEEAREERLNKL